MARRLSTALLAWSTTMLLSCKPSVADTPLRSDPWPEPQTLLVWHGTGEAYRMVEGSWQRTPPHDYEFTVVQRRYPDRWESTKTQHRRHPEYDGTAGPRLQSLHFTLGFEDTAIEIASSLGPGTGTTDPEYREASLEIDADVSAMAPFDRYQIEQHYHYEEGRLEETVSLHDDGTPWVRVEERATLFAATAFPEPPTKNR